MIRYDKGLFEATGNPLTILAEARAMMTQLYRMYKEQNNFMCDLCAAHLKDTVPWVTETDEELEKSVNDYMGKATPEENQTVSNIVDALLHDVKDGNGGTLS